MASPQVAGDLPRLGSGIGGQNAGRLFCRGCLVMDIIPPAVVCALWSHVEADRESVTLPRGIAEALALRVIKLI